MLSGTAAMVPPRVYVWFEIPDGVEDYFCIEFHGGYQHDARWYRPFWRRLRMELGSIDAESDSGWKHGNGGLAGKVWRLRLTNNEVLRNPLSREQVMEALDRTIQAFNTFPHNVGIVMEVI